MNEFVLILPHLIILCGAFLFILLPIFIKYSKKIALRVNICIIIAALIVQLWVLLSHQLQDTTIFYGTLYSDKLSMLLSLVILILSLTIMYMFKNYESTKESSTYNNYDALILLDFAIFGAMVLSGAAELITLFIALEIVSISSFALIGIRKSDYSQESVLKYFVLSVFLGAFYLMGSSIIFGTYGTTKLHHIYDLAYNHTSALSILGFAFILFTIFFKFGIFGFYNWSVDSYFGSSMPMSGFFVTIGKIVAFALLVRVLLYGFFDLAYIWKPILYILAILSMFAGNLLSIKQENIKKLFISSGIVHTGYILIGLCVIDINDMKSLSPSLFYLIAYVIPTAGAFLVLSTLTNKDGSNMNYQNFKGLSTDKPIISLVMTIFMLSFIGFPYTIGFIGKVQVFMFAISQKEILLAFLGIANTILSVYYYLKIIVCIYFYDDSSKPYAFYSPTRGFASFILAIMFFTVIGGLGFITTQNIVNILQ